MAARAESTPLPAYPRTHVLLPNGLTIAYADLGPADGPVVVLLHGITNSADSWWNTAHALQALAPDLRLVIPDLRGHGHSRMPADASRGQRPQDLFTMDAMADDVVGLLDALEIDRAAIVGHSMGSLIAQQLGLQHLDRVESITLIATTGDARHCALLRDWLIHDVINDRWRAALETTGDVSPTDAMTSTPLDADPDAVEWLEEFWCVYPITPHVNTRALAEQAAALPLVTWLGAATAISEYDALEALASMTVPTLVLWGAQDPFFPRADQDALIAALTRASTVGGAFTWKQYGVLPLPASGLQVDEIGHNLTIEIPDQLATDLLAFIRTGRPTTVGYRTAAPADPMRIELAPDPAPLVCVDGRTP